MGQASLTELCALVWQARRVESSRDYSMNHLDPAQVITRGNNRPHANIPKNRASILRFVSTFSTISAVTFCCVFLETVGQNRLGCRKGKSCLSERSSRFGFGTKNIGGERGNEGFNVYRRSIAEQSLEQWGASSSILVTRPNHSAKYSPTGSHCH